MRRMITATVQNQSGVLQRITSVLTKRQFNIESISVGHAHTQELSKVTIVVEVEDHRKVEQLIKQLHKQIDILKVIDITELALVARELALVKVAATPQMRSEVTVLIQPFRASIIDVSSETITIEVTGNHEKVEALLELLRPYGITDIARTGLTAMTRGTQRTVHSFVSSSII
ncbi:acetolactate synthase 3 regulatory subunit [Fictibacillus macauensis ZFHKF-1]|uniref:Acetolactate synthase small subunit n=1 Tax=Fictibacillus macauensis ZFHKF-1 TaxID=1196324 RepID=I8UEP0_9BACL|nr:acetolactate synthase small subunit [Fictibacillus macauensis]EIT85375.1 acetolactate synthase 3 regulatory subunit [Fictibacillus macauensis ZFHKF-1]